MDKIDHASPALRTGRADLLARLEAAGEVDLIIIGGGATGLGIALDARLRGLSVVLLESHDFGGGTSSRATKLIHGGVRYMAQGRLGLVHEALHERRILLRIAPHLAQPLGFVVPAYGLWQLPFYGVGLRAYDALSGSDSLGSTRCLGRAETLRELPGVRAAGLQGGILYWDGQFDDARLALALARSAAAQGALLLNHCAVTGLVHEAGRLGGVQWSDARGPAQGRLRARCVVNATGVWVDAVRQLDAPGSGQGVGHEPMIMPSQGAHLVVDRSFLPSDRALLVPRTQDGRVLFAVPWLGRVILGTTDTPSAGVAREPLPFEHEIDFILAEAAKVLARAPGRADILSQWVGLRPLVRPSRGDEATRKVSREHTIRVSPTGLLTVTGGKWTTYRAMAEDVLAQCERAGLLPGLPPSRTADFMLVGAPAGGQGARSLADAPGLAAYGTEASQVAALPGAGQDLCPGLSEAMVRFAVRHEYARTVEDVLARRSRLLFLDAALAASLGPRVAGIVAEETGADPDLAGFNALAAQYAGGRAH